ncbi:MAG: hypothetical protein WBF43_07105 [Methylocella sp.]
MNSAFLDAARRDAEVAKTIKEFGAPIDPPGAETFGAYLEENYGARSARASPPIGSRNQSCAVGAPA